MVKRAKKLSDVEARSGAGRAVERAEVTFCWSGTEKKTRMAYQVISS